VTLLPKLAIVLAAFVAILATVVRFAFRERRLASTIAHDDRAGQQASDARILAVIMCGIFGGMLLALLVAWIVFF
jgi:hypothetical protein